MIINTKFNLGQRVWLMYENAPFEVEIVEIIPAEFRLNNAGIPTAKSTHKYGIKRVKPPIDPYDGYGKQLPKSTLSERTMTAGLTISLKSMRGVSTYHCESGPVSLTIPSRSR